MIKQTKPIPSDSTALPIDQSVGQEFRLALVKDSDGRFVSAAKAEQESEYNKVGHSTHTEHRDIQPQKVTQMVEDRWTRYSPRADLAELRTHPLNVPRPNTAGRLPPPADEHTGELQTALTSSTEGLTNNLRVWFKSTDIQGLLNKNDYAGFAYKVMEAAYKGELFYHHVFESLLEYANTGRTRFATFKRSSLQYILLYLEIGKSNEDVFELIHLLPNDKKQKYAKALEYLRQAYKPVAKPTSAFFQNKKFALNNPLNGPFFRRNDISPSVSLRPAVRFNDKSVYALARGYETAERIHFDAGIDRVAENAGKKIRLYRGMFLHIEAILNKLTDEDKNHLLALDLKRLPKDLKLNLRFTMKPQRDDGHTSPGIHTRLQVVSAGKSQFCSFTTSEEKAWRFAGSDFHEDIVTVVFQGSFAPEYLVRSRGYLWWSIEKEVLVHGHAHNCSLMLSGETDLIRIIQRCRKHE